VLNDDRVPAPRPQQGRPAGWTPSTIREVLYRDLYRGLITWNRTRKRNAWGQQKQHEHPASAWIDVKAPDLRIVSVAEWKAAHGRLDAVRRVYLRSNTGQLWGRPASGLESKYLLTGLARRGACGGTLTVRSRSHGSGRNRRRAYFYACSSFHHRGRAVCANSLEMRLSEADEAVLNALEKDLLDEGVIEDAMTRAIAKATSVESGGDARRAAVVKAIEQTTTELERLTAAILAGGEAATLVQAMRDRERKLEALRNELRDLNQPKPTSYDAGRLRQSLRQS
jgi:Recombinase/Recombinase zinc beta ribbon domain